MNFKRKRRKVKDGSDWTYPQTEKGDSHQGRVSAKRQAISANNELLDWGVESVIDYHSQRLSR